MEDLKQRGALIVDSSGHSKRLLKTILASIGIDNIHCVNRTDEALQILRGRSFGVVFCDEAGGPLDPIEFVSALRRDLESLDLTVPVILVSAGMSREQVAGWRDAGGSDVIIKPVSAEVMQLRLKNLVLDPKAFVATRAFIGPDRRREGVDRRQFGERPPSEDRRRGSKPADIFSIPPTRPQNP